MSRTCFLLALLAALAGGASAQMTEPDRRPITLVVPYPAGGPSDAGARRVAPELERELGQPVLVQNIAGATGAIATQKVASAPPDGLTLMLSVVLSGAVTGFSGAILGLVGIDPTARLPTVGLNIVGHALAITASAVLLMTMFKLLLVDSHVPRGALVMSGPTLRWAA